MKRLTKEQIENIAIEFDELGFRATNPCGKETNDRIVKDIHKAFNELIELKELEEDLNFDLITLLRAIMDGIYVIKDGYIEYGSISDSEFETHCNQLKMLFSEYGKTWALTKEELEEE